MAIELENLTKKYGDITAVDNLSLTFEEHSLNVLIGPSGCGKTTTLEMLNRLREISSGDIKYDGVSIHDINPIELRRGIGYVIQEIGLFPHMTIYENIAVVPRLVGWKETKIGDRVSELLELVNLEEDFVDRYPAELSGGQRQRVGVARGLAADPKILLMDEPFGAIDPINREVLQDSFLEIQREIKKTIVFVTHDIREAVKLGDKIALLDRGKLVQFDTTTQLLTNPANEFVEDMLGSDRALKGLELMRVEIPVTVPAIAAGARSAATINIGTATIAAAIGAGGLGETIFIGLRVSNESMIFAGALVSALLAVVIDTVLGFVERGLTSKGIQASQEQGV